MLHLLLYLHRTTNAVERIKKSFRKNSDIFCYNIDIFERNFERNTILIGGFDLLKEGMNLHRIIYFGFFSGAF